jgi:hypothetical protein
VLSVSVVTPVRRWLSENMSLTVEMLVLLCDTVCVSIAPLCYKWLIVLVSDHIRLTIVTPIRTARFVRSVDNNILFVSSIQTDDSVSLVREYGIHYG